MHEHLSCSLKNSKMKTRCFNHQKVIKTPCFHCFGAATQIRTGDLVLTKDALYLLSYSSNSVYLCQSSWMDYILTKDALYLLSYSSIFTSLNRHALRHPHNLKSRIFKTA